MPIFQRKSLYKVLKHKECAVGKPRPGWRDAKSAPAFNHMGQPSLRAKNKEHQRLVVLLLPYISELFQALLI